ncbi:MAG: hypothetical protein HYY52_02185 [Candidatus Melainabacteria bacterium]|nr:hypothetical protein [Candidatus Melainabacteria bacterium]
MSIINSITGKPVKDPIVARMLERCQKAIDEAKNSPPPPLTEEEKQEYFRKAAEEAKKSNEGTITRLKDEVYN